jgi:hypothetical protein
VPKVLELWWSVSRWLYVLLGVVTIVGLGLMSRTPQAGLGKVGIIIALVAEVVGIGIDVLTELITLVARGGGSALRAILDGTSMLASLVGLIGVIALVLGVAALTKELRGQPSLPAVGVAVVAAVIGYLIPLASRILKLQLTWPGSPTALALNAIALLRYGAMLFVLWQGARAIAAASAAASAQPAGERRW